MPPLFLLALSSTKSPAPNYPTVLATFFCINTETLKIESWKDCEIARILLDLLDFQQFLYGLLRQRNTT